MTNMANLTFNDLVVLAMVVELAKSRNAFTEEEMPDVNLVQTKLSNFLENLKAQIESNSEKIDEIEPNS